MTEKIFIKSEKNERLDEFLRRELPKIAGEISNSKIRRLIFAHALRVDGIEIKNPAFVLKKNSRIELKIDREKLFAQKTPDDIDFEFSQKSILFEDDDVLVADKPARFPAEAGFVQSRGNLRDCAVQFLFERQKIEKPNAKNPPYIGLVHRLDRDTSGAILLAKNRAANAFCHAQFENRTVEKIYRAVVPFKSGIEKDFSVEFCMDRISKKGESAKWGRSSGGVFSKTDFSVLGEREIAGKKTILLECRPQTGRTHQIRVHLESLGLPIFGDEKYGGEKYPRLLLHSASISFALPSTEERIKVVSPFPAEFL